jgi:hypothetical protein
MLQISARFFIRLALCFPMVTNLLAQSTGSQVVRARTVPIQRQLVPQPQSQPQSPTQTTKIQELRIVPQPQSQPQSPTQTTFSKSTPSSYQINAQLGEGKTIRTVLSPNGAYTAIVRDGAEMRLYLQKEGSYTLVGAYNKIGGVTWSKDSTTVQFRATKAVRPEKLEEREATYQPATHVLKWRIIRVISTST